MAVDFRGHLMFPSTGFNGDGHISRFHYEGGNANCLWTDSLPGTAEPLAVPS